MHNSSGTGTSNWSYDSVPWQPFGITFHTYQDDGVYNLNTTFGVSREIRVGAEMIQDVDLVPRIFGTEDNALSPGNVMTFTRSDWSSGGIDTAGITAEVDWGDGTPVSGVTLSITPDNRLALDIGTHTYDEEGLYPITILLSLDGVQRVLSTQADIVDPLLGAVPHQIQAAKQQSTGEALLATIVTGLVTGNASKRPLNGGATGGATGGNGGGNGDTAFCREATAGGNGDTAFCRGRQRGEATGTQHFAGG